MCASKIKMNTITASFIGVGLYLFQLTPVHNIHFQEVMSHIYKFLQSITAMAFTSQTADVYPISLAIQADRANNVCVCGSWNNWGDHPLQYSDQTDQFQTTINLPVGVHCFKFKVNQEWRCSELYPTVPDYSIKSTNNCIVVTKNGKTKGGTAIVVLGYRLNPDGSFHPLLKERVGDAAKLFHSLEFSPDNFMIVTGGWAEERAGKPESSVMKNLLVDHFGFEEQLVIEEPCSVTTVWNAIFSRSILLARQAEKVIVVTAAFHLPRAKLIFDHALGDKFVPGVNLIYHATGENAISEKESQLFYTSEKRFMNQQAYFIEDVNKNILK